MTQVLEPPADATVEDLADGPMPMPDSGNCPPGMKPDADKKNCVPMSAEEIEALGGKPSPGTAPDKRLKKNKGKGYADDTVALAAATPDTPPDWRGVLCVEGQVTGDGREFAVDSITWPDPQEVTMALQWQKESSHGGMPTDVTVAVGRIDRVWREKVTDTTNNIMGEGRFDTHTDAVEAQRRMGENMLNGTSINADDITDADIEYVFPEPEEGEDEDEDIFFLLFGPPPEKIVFHAGRLRATTLCDIPAFVEAVLHTVDPEGVTAGATVVDLAAVATHSTDTADGSWDAAANEKRLPSPMPEGTAKKAYAWIDGAVVDNGEVPKSGGKFIHHEVNADGSPGAANLTACSSGIGILHGGRGGTSIPKADQRGVYDHLAKHLRDGGQEPPPYAGQLESLVAHAWHDEWRPPRAWFNNPELGQVMPIMVTDGDRVYGYAAQWGECHLGFKNECVMPPRDDDFTRYMTGEILCEDGSRVLVGQITAGMGHAPLSYGANRASEHYENTDAVVADVAVGNDKRGIWVAGAIRPSAHTARVQALRASGQVSPDWRYVGGRLRMVALLTVNTSGYQTPRARSFVASGQIRSLIVEGMVSVKNTGPSDEELDKRALRLISDQLAARVHPEV